MTSLAAAQRNRGVSLVEVLVALVVLGLGVLAIIALQLVSKRTNADAHAQTQAAQLAYDLLERMRINNSQVALQEYLARSGSGIGRSQQALVTCTSGSPCNRASQADFDIYTFERAIDGAGETAVTNGVTSLTGGLMQPTACIAGPSGGTSGIYTVTLVWRSQVPLPVNSTVACGLGLGLYGTAANTCASVGADDCLRRVVQIQSFINVN